MANLDQFIGLTTRVGLPVASGTGDASVDSNGRIKAADGGEFLKFPGVLTPIAGSQDAAFADALPQLCAVVGSSTAVGVASYLSTQRSAGQGSVALGKIGTSVYAIPLGVSATVANSGYYGGYFSANADFSTPSNYSWSNIRAATWDSPLSSVLITSKEILCSFAATTNSVITRSTGAAGSFTAVSSALVAGSDYKLACNSAESLYVAAYRMSTAGGVFTSTDGQTWTTRTPVGGSAVNISWAFWCPYLAAGAGAFVYLNASGGYFHSTDGYTATAYAAASVIAGTTIAASTILGSVNAQDRGQSNVAHSANATILATPSGLLRSTDCMAWTMVSGDDCKAVWYQGTDFYGVTKYGAILKSSDNGLTWYQVVGFVHDTQAALLSGKRALVLGARYVASDNKLYIAYGPSDCMDGGSVFRINAAGYVATPLAASHIGAWPSVSGASALPYLVRIK